MLLPHLCTNQTSLSVNRHFAMRIQRRRILWAVSLSLLLVASLFVSDAIQNSSLFGLLFGGSWIGTVLVNTLFVDYLLRR